MSVQLASYEANAAALLGDTARVTAALDRADMLADVMTAGDSSSSPWALPPQRQAIFRLSVLLRTSDPDGALRAATEGGYRLGIRRAADTRNLGSGPHRGRDCRAAPRPAGRRAGRSRARPRHARRPQDRDRHRMARRPRLPARDQQAWRQQARSRHDQIRAFTAAALPSDAREAG
jgi:hypothetical protein